MHLVQPKSDFRLVANTGKMQTGTLESTLQAWVSRSPLNFNSLVQAANIDSQFRLKTLGITLDEAGSMAIHSGGINNQH